jgi:hypothetical protein
MEKFGESSIYEESRKKAVYHQVLASCGSDEDSLARDN